MIETNIQPNITLLNKNREIDIYTSNLKLLQSHENDEIKLNDLKRRLLMLELLEEKRKRKIMEMEEKKQIEQLMKESNDNKKINELTLSQNNLSKSVQSLNIIKPPIEENKTENTKIKKIKKLLSQNIINEKDEKILSRSLSPQNILTQKIQKKISLNPIKKKSSPTYKLTYHIVRGNNSRLIEQCFEYRNKIWAETEFKTYCDLFWSPLSRDIDYHNLQNNRQYVNHLEYHKVISNKKHLFLTLLKHCEKKSYNLFSFFPFTIILELKKEDLKNQIEQFKNIYNNIEKYIANGGNEKRNNKYSDLFNTYLNKKLGSSQKITIPQTHYNGKNLWILKAVNLNRGMCIKVESDLEKIENDIMQIKEHYKMDNLYGKKKKCKRIILQKYIEKPLLYHGRKFDIRLWVLFIGNQPDFVYVFKEGHLKATCEQYDSNSTDLYIHLTNYSVQKHNAEFSKIEIGNEIPFKDLQKQFEDNNINVNFKKMIYPKICKIVRITAGAAKQRINLMNRKNCFEIFGYDFMIDENFNPFLIEINTNPGLEFSSPLIRMLLPRLIDDAFKLTIDQEFFSSNIFSNMPSPFPVEGYSNEENMFDKFSVL